VTFKWANSHRIALAMAVIAPAAALWPTGAALAQFSESYKFLDAVRKKDGDKVNEALQNPSSQIVNTKDVSTGETALTQPSNTGTSTSPSSSTESPWACAR